MEICVPLFRGITATSWQGDPQAGPPLFEHVLAPGGLDRDGHGRGFPGLRSPDLRGPVTPYPVARPAGSMCLAGERLVCRCGVCGRSEVMTGALVCTMD